MLHLANAGVPMLAAEIILMGVMLVPIVILESKVIRRRLALPTPEALKGVTVANLLTMGVGVPLAWAAMFALQIMAPREVQRGDSVLGELGSIVSTAAWIGGDSTWELAAAATVLLLPCFVLSVLIERRFLAFCWPECARSALRSTVFRANVYSYVFLLVLGTCWTISSSRAPQGTPPPAAPVSP